MNSHPTYNHSYNPKESGLFRVGDPKKTRESVLGGKRLLSWVANDSTELRDMSHIAGWDDLDPVIADGVGIITIPGGTRSGASVLSGHEAWEGEKQEVVQAILKYLDRVKEDTRRIDIGLSLGSVAVTKSRKVFFTPPHELTSDPEIIDIWSHELVTDLVNVLANDTSSQNLIEQFSDELTKRTAQRNE